MPLYPEQEGEDDGCDERNEDFGGIPKMFSPVDKFVRVFSHTMDGEEFPVARGLCVWADVDLETLVLDMDGLYRWVYIQRGDVVKQVRGEQD